MQGKLHVTRIIDICYSNNHTLRLHISISITGHHHLFPIRSATYLRYGIHNTYYTSYPNPRKQNYIDHSQIIIQIEFVFYTHIICWGQCEKIHRVPISPKSARYPSRTWIRWQGAKSAVMLDGKVILDSIRSELEKKTTMETDAIPAIVAQVSRECIWVHQFFLSLFSGSCVWLPWWWVFLLPCVWHSGLCVGFWASWDWLLHLFRPCVWPSWRVRGMKDFYCGRYNTASWLGYYVSYIWQIVWHWCYHCSLWTLTLNVIPKTRDKACFNNTTSPKTLHLTTRTLLGLLHYLPRIAPARYVARLHLCFPLLEWGPILLFQLPKATNSVVLLTTCSFISKI